MSIHCVTACLVLLCSFECGSAHVKTPTGVGLAPTLRGYERLDATKPAAITKGAFIEHGRADTESKEDASLAYSKNGCTIVLVLLVSFCCFGGALKECIGDQAAAALSTLCSIGMFVYLWHNGTYAVWWSGKERVGFTCQLVCLWCLVQMTCLSCILCCVCAFVGAAFTIKNHVIKEMRKQYEEKVKQLSGPRQEYYESELFKSKCDMWFDKADADQNGTLDMSELKDICVEVVGDPNIIQVVPLLQQAFDDNHNSQVEKDEFAEMMKFVSVMALQEGKFTEQQAYEVLQLPETATAAEVSRAYRKMALRWHPDRRFGVDSQVAAKDMGEINDAKAKLDELQKPAKNNDK